MSNSKDAHDLLFVHVALNRDGKNVCLGIEARFLALMADLLDACGPESRELSLMTTKLQEASFFAKKAVSSQARYREENHD